MSSVRALAMVALMAAGSARAATLLVPDFTDTDPEEGMRLRLEVLRSIGVVRGLTLAPLFKFKKLAKAAQLDPSDLANSATAQALGRDGTLDGILGGAIDDSSGKRLLHVQLFDGAGQLVYRREVDVSEGSIRPDQLDRIARGVATALHVEGGGEPVEPAAKSQDAGATPEAPPAPGMDSGEPSEPADPGPAHRHVRPRSGDETAAAAVPADSDESAQDRYQDPLFEFALGGMAGTFNLMSVNELNASKGDPCTGSGGSGCYVAPLSSSLYVGLGGEVQTFPWHANNDLLAGLGAIASVSFAPMSFAGGKNVTFSAQDTRFEGGVAYRLRLPLFSGDAAIYSPSIGARLQVGVWNFDVGQNTFNEYPTDRLALPELGLEVLEPLGHYVRLTLRGAYFVTPYPGSTIERTLADTQTWADGYQLGGEIEGHLGPANQSAFTAHLKADYTHFDDCYVLVVGQGCAYKDTENYLSATLLVGYAFY